MSTYECDDCKVRVAGMGINQHHWRNGKIIVFNDAGHWKIRIDSKISKSPILPNVRINKERILAVVMNGSRLNIRLNYNSMTICVDHNGQYDSQYVDNINIIRNVLQTLKQGKEPLDFGQKKGRPLTPSRVEKQERYEASDVASLLSGDEESSVFTSSRSPTSVRKSLINNNTRAGRILSRSNSDTSRKHENKENALLQTSLNEESSAKAFYGGTATTPRRSSTLDDIHAVSASRDNYTPKRTLTSCTTYSMNRKPGLLPNPTPTQTRIVKRGHTDSPVLQGFSNIGNTCYMNAILQSLLAMTPFFWDLIRNLSSYKHLPCDGLYLSMLRLCHIRRSQDRDLLRNTLEKLKKAISSNAKRFSGYEQHDAQEFLAQVLDQIHEEVQTGEKNADNSLTDPTVNNFQIEVLHEIKCLGCESTIPKSEVIYNMSVEMPESVDGRMGSIQYSLDTFLQPEMLDYKCEKCGHGQSEVSHRITKRPRILVVHLKRYSYDCTFMVHSKVGKAVHIPLVVNIDKNCDRGTKSPRQPENPQSKHRKSSDELDGIFNSPRRKFFEAKKPVYGKDDADLQRALKQSQSDYHLEEKRRREFQGLESLSEEEQINLAMRLSMDENSTIRPRGKANGDKANGDLTHGGTTHGGSTHGDPTHGDLPPADMWLDQADSAPSSLDSDLEKASIDNVWKTEIHSPDKSETQSPLCLKRRRTVHKTPSIKSRKTLDIDNAVIISDSEQNGESDSDLPDLRTVTGLKGGADLITEEDSSPEKCAKCRHLTKDCSCTRPLTEPNECVCHLEKDKSTPSDHCLYCRDPDRKTKIQTRDSKVRKSFPFARNYEKKFEREDTSDWIARTSERLDSTLLVESGFDKELEAAKKASLLESRVELSEEDQLKRALEESLRDQGGEEEEIERAVKASLEEYSPARTGAGTPERRPDSRPPRTPDSPRPRTPDSRRPRTPDSRRPRTPDSRPRTPDSRSVERKPRVATPHQTEYKLVGVVSHIGEFAGSGHYVADVYDSQLKQWKHYDDSKIKDTSADQVRFEKQKTGYIFFYMDRNVHKQVEAQITLSNKEDKLKERSPNVSNSARKYTFSSRN